MSTDNAILLKPDRVWTNGQTLEGACVLVRGDRIHAVGTGVAANDARTIALAGCTLLPGLIDAHSHLFLHPYNETPWDDQVLKQSESYRTARAVKHAADTLRVGFTTLRDLGTEGANYADVGLKRAIEGGIVPGPWLFVATRAIVATGGYAPMRKNYRPDCCIAHGAEEASGIDEVVRAVRHQAAHGADWIKVYADYRVGPGGETGATFSRDELKALVDTAHDLGRPVSAHATCDEGIKRAVLAGVDTIEHGYGGTRATFALMAEKGTALLPTLTAPEAIAECFSGHIRGGEPDARMMLAAQGFANARAESVVIGCGSDVGVFAHGENFRELEWMARLGMSANEVLLAATAINAKILRREGGLGMVSPGALADLIAVKGDPTHDLAALRLPVLAMKNGLDFLNKLEK